MKDYEEYSGNKIDFQEIPTEQYANWLKTKLAAGQAPDIILTWPEANASSFFPDDNFMDLTGEEWLSRQTDSAIRNETYDGRIIGWGGQGGNPGWGMVYNKAVFKAAGIESVPKSFSEFMDDCKKIADNGKVPFAGSFKDEWTAGIWLSIMGPLAQRDIPDYYTKLCDGSAKFSDSKVLSTTVDQFKQIYDAGYFGEDAFSNGLTEAVGEVIKGDAAMTLMTCTPDSYMADLNVGYDPTNIGMFPAPFADNNTLASYDGGYLRAINAKTKNEQVCKDYFNFLSKPENLEKYYASANMVSICPAFQENYDKFQWKDSTKDLVANSDGQTYTTMEVGVTFWDSTVVGKDIVQVMLGNMTTQQALADMDSQREQLIEAAG